MVTFCSLHFFRLSFYFMFLSQCKNFVDAQAQDYFNATASLSTQWTNHASPTLMQYKDGSIVQPILLRGKGGYEVVYACGFYCNGNCNTYLFAIFLIQLNCGALFVGSVVPNPQVVWSANRNNPVKIGATLELTSEGNLVLKDADGTVAWSTNTSGKSVVGLNMTDLGNLVLFDKNNATVWQSFDQPTDSLVLGQKLMRGQRLMPSVSKTNWTADSMITISMNADGLSAQMETNPPQIYYQDQIDILNATNESPYVEFVNGSLALFLNSTTKISGMPVPQASSAQYMRLGSDGRLRVYELVITDWKEVADLFKDVLGDCGFPTVCGQYGICSYGYCSCLASKGGMSYFKQADEMQANLGCTENVPSSCGAPQYQNLLELQDVAYFTFTPDLQNVDASNCKEACAKNCSCKAAIFKQNFLNTDGGCYFLNRVFSLMKIDKRYHATNYTVYLKVQDVSHRRNKRLTIIVGSILGAIFAMMIVIVVKVFHVRKRDNSEAEEDHLDQVPGTLTRFTYDRLKAITGNFSKKLGEGGFGCVYEGTLIDSTKVAVKLLHGFGQVKKSFLTEVETIGNIHHVNLVQLVGFCAEKSHRLLIYEYMLNGSLDKWIFHKSNECVLNWQQRKKIILDIAKGLNYLHEDCRQKILHLDIKPQNILLDGNFSAKVADFGLSKLINRDQSRVVTTMRGTPGYLAPEWLSATITAKVDVYSFGVVILEIVCGRKIFDHSLDEEDMHLLSVFKRKAEEERLVDIVDKFGEDMQQHGPEAMEMMRIATWCLQRDYKKRPSMSMVIKVLEGVLEVPGDLDYDFFAQHSTNGAGKFCQIYDEVNDATPLLPSVLSGPR